MMLKLGQVPTIVISSAVVAKEALQKNDISFSNRNVIEVIQALNHHQNSIIWLPVAAKWRNLRKICSSQVFSSSRLEASQGIRKDKVKDLLAYVQKNSEAGMAVDIGQAAFTTTLNLLSRTFFSVDLGDPSSQFVRDLKETIQGMTDEAGNPNFADNFPLLRKLDPQGRKQRMSVHFRKMIDLFTAIIDQRLQNKRPSDSMQTNDILDALLGFNQDQTEEIEQPQIPHLLLDLFGAGTDTTSITLELAMAELLRNPEKIKKAQAELNEIVGKRNPMEEADIARLPYLKAVVKETLRLHPAVPFLVPRKVDSDVQLSGFTVPKNAQVLVNVWAIGRDPDTWQNPNSFQPERFLGSETDVKGHDFELIPFGAGRRICPGLSLAIRMIHLMLGSLIHEFNWELEGGTTPDKMDMEERFGFTLEKAQSLCAIPIRVC